MIPIIMLLSAGGIAFYAYRLGKIQGFSEGFSDGMDHTQQIWDRSIEETAEILKETNER